MAANQQLVLNQIRSSTEPQKAQQKAQLLPKDTAEFLFDPAASIQTANMCHKAVQDIHKHLSKTVAVCEIRLNHDKSTND